MNWKTVFWSEDSGPLKERGCGMRAWSSDGPAGTTVHLAASTSTPEKTEDAVHHSSLSPGLSSPAVHSHLGLVLLMRPTGQSLLK